MEGNIIFYKLGKFKFVFVPFLIWWIFLLWTVFISNRVLSYRPGQEFTNILSTQSSKSIIHSPFLYPLANFDGVHYLAIAKYGYTTEAGFFPLYPALIKVFSFVINNFFDEDYFISGLLISNVACIISLIYLYKLIKLDFTNEVTKQSIIFLLIFPTSFFFACIYSESLFFLLLVLCFYFARKKMWLFAAISGLFLSSTRIVGVLILPALLWEFYVLEKNNWRLNIQKITPFMLIPLGIFSYMLFNFLLWGDWFYFVKAQGMLSNSRSVDQIILFPQTLFRYFKIIMTVPYQQYEWWIAFLEVGMSVFVLSLLFIAYKQKVRMSYLVFSVLAILLPISSGTLSGMPRYVLVAFPVFIAMAQVKNRLLKTVYSIVCVFLLIILWTLFSKGYYVA